MLHFQFNSESLLNLFPDPESCSLVGPVSGVYAAQSVYEGT